MYNLENLSSVISATRELREEKNTQKLRLSLCFPAFETMSVVKQRPIKEDIVVTVSSCRRCLPI